MYLRPTLASLVLADTLQIAKAVFASDIHTMLYEVSV